MANQPAKKTGTKSSAAQPKRAATSPVVFSDQTYVPSGRASLVRLELIHRELRQASPDGTCRVTIGSLQKLLGVSRSTVKQDLILLEIFNAPLDYEERRKTLYYTHPYELRPPVWLQERQALALLVAIRLAARSRAFPLGGDLIGALRSLAPLIAGGVNFGPETLDPIFSTPSSSATEAEARHFAGLCSAINHRQEVRLVYRKAKHDPSPEVRLVHPLHWYVRPDACLLIGHDSRIGERRNFELVRIQSIEPTGNTFEPPTGFDLKRYLSGAYGRFVGEPVHTVRVRIDRDYVPRMRERPWQNETLKELDDGSAEATFHVCHTADLEQDVLRALGAVEVLEPADVRERVRLAAEQIAARHARRENGR